MSVEYNDHVIIQFSEDFRSAPVIKWCKDNIGERGTLWEVYFHNMGYKGIFMFLNKADATFFLLRWKR